DDDYAPAPGRRITIRPTRMEVTRCMLAADDTRRDARCQAVAPSSRRPARRRPGAGRADARATRAVYSFSTSQFGGAPLQSLMQDFPLTLHHIVWRMEKLFARKEIVTKRERGLHRYTYGELVARTRRLAAALARLGVKQGDRVATLAWNNYRHVELYFAV